MNDSKVYEGQIRVQITATIDDVAVRADSAEAAREKLVRIARATTAISAIHEYGYTAAVEVVSDSIGVVDADAVDEDMDEMIREWAEWADFEKGGDS